MKKRVVGILVWDFVAGSLGTGNVGNLAPTQVGPFATQMACAAYNAKVANFYLTFPYFSTTAK